MKQAIADAVGAGLVDSRVDDIGLGLLTDRGRAVAHRAA
jgi:hypothetical protein